MKLDERPAAEANGHAPHAHSVQFYDDDAYLLEEVNRRVGATLTAGGAAVIIATAEHRQALAERLATGGPDLAELSRLGRCGALDAAETLAQFMVDGHPDPERFAECIGDALAKAQNAIDAVEGRVTAFGEMVVLLYVEGNAAAAVELEQLWNELARSYTFSLHCAYPMRVFAREVDGAWIDGICAAHSAVFPTEDYGVLETDEDRAREVAMLQQKAQALEREVAERARAEASLAERNQQLGEALAARDLFLSVAAHELKTPITGIRLSTQLFQRVLGSGNAQPAQVERVLERLDAQTEKLAQMVNQLLDISRLQQGRLTLEPTETDLSAIVRSQVESVRAIAPNRDIRASLPDCLVTQADALRIEQVATNLLDNAVKYSPDGGAVEVELAVSEDAAIRLSVRDHGISVPVEHRDRIFEPFYRVPGHDRPEGIGLGLHITRQIVELHGGELSADFPDDGGTRFVVTLPLKGAA